jgi:hypothetical protein
MLSALAEEINDNRFLRLIKQMLQAGYLEDWEWNATLSGVPQGGVVSPVLSSIYLNTTYLRVRVLRGALSCGVDLLWRRVGLLVLVWLSTPHRNPGALRAFYRA